MITLDYLDVLDTLILEEGERVYESRSEYL